jgi:tetratricopeptide (TPR) repeat protein
MRTFWDRYRTPLLAMALNLSGTGAGYLWARATWFLLVHWIGLFVWWLLARSTTEWLAVLLAWVGLSVVAAGLLRARRTVRERAVRAPGGKVSAVVGAVLVVVLLAGSAVAVGTYRAGAADAYARGVAAHTDGDCVAASGTLDTVDDGALRRGFAASPEAVDAEIEACAILESARSSADSGDHRTAVETYDDYLGSYPDTVAVRFAGAAAEQAAARLDLGDTLAAQGSLDEALETYTAVAESELPAAQEVPEHVTEMFRTALAARDNACGVAEELQWFAAQGDVDVAADVAREARDRLPGTLLRCARLRFADAREGAQDHPRSYDAGRFGEARSTAARVAREFPRSAYAGQARTLMDRISGAAHTAAERKKALDRQAAERRRQQAIIDEIEETTGTRLPTPRTTGSSGSTSARVEVENGTSETLEVLWTGPTTGKLTVPAGSGGRCLDGGGPTRSISLVPGDYTVVVRAVTGAGVIPYKGSWDMSTGTGYGECYYIETTFG